VSGVVQQNESASTVPISHGFEKKLKGLVQVRASLDPAVVHGGRMVRRFRAEGPVLGKAKA
jgi:hypothetical protein